MTARRLTAAQARVLTAISQGYQSIREGDHLYRSYGVENLRLKWLSATVGSLLRHGWIDVPSYTSGSGVTVEPAVGLTPDGALALAAWREKQA